MNDRSQRGGNRRETLHVDCDTCAVRDLACGDCVVSVLLGMPDSGVEIDSSEQAALEALADSGLVPPLRLIPGARRVEPVQGGFEWPELG